MQQLPTMVWIDMEMTGLDPEYDRILEIAVLVTNHNLDITHTGPDLVIHQPEHVLAGMDDWNTHTHHHNGLIKAVRNATMTELQAETIVMDFLSGIAQSQKAILCGNTVWQDWRFLKRYMPAITSFLHYRLLDISALKHLANFWNPNVARSLTPKKVNHRAMDDIVESVQELRHYRDHLLVHAR